MEVQFVKSYKKSNNKLLRNKTLSLPSLSVSNDKIIELIKSDKPFYISRLGGVETYYAFTWDIFNKTSVSELLSLPNLRSLDISSKISINLPNLLILTSDIFPPTLVK